MISAAPDTIFALSTARGRAGIAVVRVSGPGAGAALDRLAGERPEPRRAALRALCRPEDGVLLDRGLVLWFPGPASATGEDVAEFHIHGGPAVIAAILQALGTIPGLRPADPGEFTRRAFENGRLDLTEVEGLADLLAAETEAQRRQALRQFEGALGALYEGWRARLVPALAYAEAEIDFSDEDVPENLSAALRPGIAALAGDMEVHLRDSGRGERLREGVTVVILGAPNAGKSSMLNSLARRDVAIVSEEAGTTRDPIEVPLDLGGYPVVVVDTAGLRDRAGAVESEGIRRARARAASADLKLVLFDAASDWDAESLGLIDRDAIPVLTKIDLLPTGHPLRRDAPILGGRTAERISTLSGEGFPALLTRLGSEVETRSGLGEAPVLTRARHRTLLEQCLGQLHAFINAGPDLPPELAAEELRLAARTLGRITGRVDVEDLLDVIFRDFCIGK